MPTQHTKYIIVYMLGPLSHVPKHIFVLTTELYNTADDLYTVFKAFKMFSNLLMRHQHSVHTNFETGI